MRTIFFIILLTIISVFTAVGQQSHLRRFTDENGLPSKVIYQMVQDTNGFLWLGTDNGFCRYDGQEFKTYQNDAAKDQEFIGVYVSQNNAIWCWNISGQLFRIQNDKLLLYEPIKKVSKEYIVSKVIQDDKGDIWIGTINQWEHNLIKCNNNDSCYLQPKIKTELEIHQFFQGFKTSQKDKTFILRKLIFFGLMKETFIHEFYKKNRTNDYTTYFFLDYKNTLCFYNLNNIIGKITLGKGRLKMEKHPIMEQLSKAVAEKIVGINIDKTGNWWIRTPNAIYAYTKDLEPINNEKPIIKDLQINEIIEDKEGGYWLATNGKGLYYMPNYQVMSYNESNSILEEDWILDIETVDENTNLVFSKQGDIYEQENGKIRRIKSLGFNIETVKRAFDKNKIYIKRNKYKLLYLYNITKNTIEKIDYSLGAIKDLIETKDTLYIGNQSLFTAIDKSEKTSLRYTNSVSIRKRTYALHKAYSQKMWVGTVDGLYLYSNQKSKKLKISDKSFFDLWVNDIVETKDSIIWAATNNEGLFAFKNEKIIDQITKENGLLSNSCTALFFDNQGDLWVNTSEGLSVLDLKTKEVKFIDKYNGLPSNNIKAIYVKDSEVILGTNQGLTIFDKSQMIAQNIPLNVTISKVLINGSDTEMKEKYHEKYDRNSFQFEFIAPSFKRSNKTIYKYKLNGVDLNWLETTSNTVVYNHLKSGKYTFQVKATDRNGTTTGPTKSIHIYIETPYWETWWYYITIGLLIAITILLVFLLVLREYKKRNDKEILINRKMSELRINALQSQMNPHFIFNALNAIQNFFTTNDGELAMIYLSKFARLIRLIFEYSKISAISLRKEIDFLKLYLQLEELRFSDKIEIDMQTIDVIDMEDVKVPPLLVQPIIENAFKHGLMHKETGGKLLVKFKQLNDKSIHCVIEDNGIGRKKAAEFSKWKPKEYKSSGVNTVQERVNLINKENNKEVIQFTIIDLVDKEGEPAGTRVEFWIKMVE
jgi:ligand-binding sensor domain-containing protein